MAQFADQVRVGKDHMFSHGGNQQFIGISPSNQTVFAMNHFAHD